MNTLEDKVTTIVFECIDKLNQERPVDNKVPVSLDTLLLAEGGRIDSLDLVNLVIDLEAAISGNFGCGISLTDDDAMSREESPFASVASLRDYVVEVIDKSRN